ncbi:MAG: hypothetical protein K9K93_06180 [Acholeplasmataceae bacterium]|nr:hypothetical protein [Acholeplasmataceae bacterium]
MKKKTYWYKIDNAGKIFPAISSSGRSNVFRLSFYLDDVVDLKTLEAAVNSVLPRFDVFAVQMKSGLFWNYFAENKHPFTVEEEPSQTCRYFKSAKNNGYLFKVYTLANKVTLETFHAISDGTGALHFLKSIVYRYFRLQGHEIDHEEKILSELPYSKKESMDMFVANYDKALVKNLREETAYHLNGERFSRHWNLLLKISLETPSFLAHVKSTYNATLTQYVCALIAFAIVNETDDFIHQKKPIKMFIPVNLRPYFNAVTLRNFSLFIKATYPSDKRAWTFEDMLAIAKESFKDQLDKEKLQQRLSSNVGFEKKLMLRILPLFLKNIAFKIGYNILGDSISTSSLSNLGIIDLPSGMKDRVLDVDFVNGGYGLTTTMASYGSKTNIIINTSLKDTSIINFIVSFLVREGLDLTLDTNYREGYDEIL